MLGRACEVLTQCTRTRFRLDFQLWKSVLRDKKLTTNYNLKQMIEDWCEQKKRESGERQLVVEQAGVIIKMTQQMTLFRSVTSRFGKYWFLIAVTFKHHQIICANCKYTYYIAVV